jgi:Sulfotransferase family
MHGQAPPPVFVGGINRSGTTLMARILGSNSALAVPPSEFLFFGRRAERPPADRADFERRLTEILRWPRVREWGLDEQEVLERSRSWPATARSLFLLPLEAYRSLLGKARLGEKSVLNEFRLGVFEAWFSDFRVVQMIRDPVSAYASTYAGRPTSVREAIRWGRLWASSAGVALSRMREDGARHRLVRYEELVGDPHTTIAAVCAFVGIEAEEAMLRLSGYAAKENSSFSVAPSGRYEGAIRTSDDVDRRGAVEPRERAALAEVCGTAAGELGYDLARVRSLVVAGAFAAEWARPRNRLRALVGPRRLT